MIKVLVFIRKLPSISMDDFIRYYEDKHVPLVNQLLPMYAAYVRNYRDAVLFGQPGDLPFDVVTELGFATRADYDRWCACLADPEIIAQIRADEAHFLDSSATIVWTVDDRASACT